MQTFFSIKEKIFKEELKWEIKWGWKGEFQRERSLGNERQLVIWFERSKVKNNLNVKCKMINLKCKRAEEFMALVGKRVLAGGLCVQFYSCYLLQFNKLIRLHSLVHYIVTEVIRSFFPTPEKQLTKLSKLAQKPYFKNTLCFLTILH